MVASFDGLDGGARGRHDDWPAGYNAGQNRSSDYGKYWELDYFPDGPTISQSGTLWGEDKPPESAAETVRH